MTTALFIALITFAFISAYTPGPNNALLLATGVNHGFRAALPMIFGVGLGFPFLILCVGLGLGRIFDVYPEELLQQNSWFCIEAVSHEIQVFRYEH